MNFDSLVARLELSLLPPVRKEEAQLRASGKFSEVQMVSLRHADSIHAMGIRCRPVWAPEELEHLTLVALLMGFGSHRSGRIDVEWSQVFVPRTGSGYTKKESRGFHDKLESEAAIVRLEQEWRRMLALFLQVAARGKPSPYLLRRLRGAPADRLGGKEEN
jgi:hypothetical protein